MAKHLERFATLLNQAIYEGRNSKWIDLVFDVYWKMSIKNAEWCGRGSASSNQWKNIAPGHNVVQWRKLLSNTDSKAALIIFIVEQRKLPESRAKLRDRKLFAICGQTCYCLSQAAWDIVEELRCSQAEADTRIPLHANHDSQNGFQTLIIVSEDTDVLNLCLGYCKMINDPIYQK